jgi:protease IV
MTSRRSGFGKILMIILAIIGSLTILAAFIAITVILISVATKDRVPAETILEIDFERGMIEYVSDDPVASAVLSELPVVRDIVESLERAKDDDRVVGIVARLGSGSISMGHVQEVRDAVISFRESGKPAIAFSETFGEAGMGVGHYYLATAFDSVYMQPSGDLGLTGIMLATSFFKNLLEKADIQPQIANRYEYKTAMNMFTEERMTDPHREANEAILQSVYGQIVGGIAEARGKSDAEVRELIERGPFIASEALAYGFVDGLAYRDEVYERLQEQVGENARFLYLDRYLARAGRPHQRGETIALIYGVGTVTRGSSGFDPVFFSSSMGAETVTQAIRDAVANKQTKAIILRVDSPGGSYVASDAIWREVARAREKGIPVIASMSNVAASGGYFVAMPADKIVAQPATITGSIGVVGGKMVLRDLYERFGITWDVMATDESALIWSSLDEYSPAHWERINAWLDRIYDDFTMKAAEGRGMTQEEIHEIAKGRVWTGEDALELGLVDALGGFAVAIDLAREAANIDPDKSIRIREYPPRRSMLELLLDDKRDSSQPAAVEAYVRIMKSMQPMLQMARQAGAAGTDEVLKAPEFELRH